MSRENDFCFATAMYTVGRWFQVSPCFATTCVFNCSMHMYIPGNFQTIQLCKQNAIHTRIYKIHCSDRAHAYIKELRYGLNWFLIELLVFSHFNDDFLCGKSYNWKLMKIAALHSRGDTTPWRHLHSFVKCITNKLQWFLRI